METYNNQEAPDLSRATLSNAASMSALYNRNNDDPAVNNRQARSNYTEVKPNCEVKIIIQPRVYGVRGTGGSSMAKSAIRLAIDTKVMEPSKFEKSSLKNTIKARQYAFSTSAEEAVSFMDTFENFYGTKCTKTFLDRAKAYADAKKELASSLNIRFDGKGKPMISDEKISQQYFETLKDYSYTGFEVYVSVKPDGVRATRSRCYRTATLEEATACYAVPFTEK